MLRDPQIQQSFNTLLSRACAACEFACSERAWAPGALSSTLTFLGRCRDAMTMTSSLSPAMVVRAPKGLWLFSAAPLAGSASVNCPVVGIITSSGIMRMSGPKSLLAEKLRALHVTQARIGCLSLFLWAQCREDVPCCQSNIASMSAYFV